MFTVNPKFDLNDASNSELVSGHATAKGTQAYARRSQVVHPACFKKVEMPDMNAEEELTLSKMIYGTGTGPNFTQTDFFQYFVLKQMVLSGGINHIDTGHFVRGHRAELVVGKALRTLFNKFGL